MTQLTWLRWIGCFVVVFAVFVPLISCQPPQQCTLRDEGAIARCADPLYDIGAFREDGPLRGFTWEFFAQRGKHYFGKLCKAFFRFDACVQPFKAACFDQEPVRSRYKTATEILEMMCRDGYQEMSENFNCLVGALTRSEMIQCQHEMVRGSQEVSNHIAYDSEYKACRVMQDYLRCVQYPIRYECGIRAWSIVHAVIAKPTAMLMPECQLNAARTVTASNLTFGLTTVLFLVIVGRIVW